MLELIIVILILLWLFGYLGRGRIGGIPDTGNLVHLLQLNVLVLVIVKLVL